MEKIYKTKDNLVIEIPLLKERFNPYMPDDYHEKMDNIVGLILPQKNCDTPEMGFAYNVDMSYKGKGDQETDFFYRYYGDKKDFVKLCKELKIEIREYPACAYCGDALLGCFTVGKKGYMCWDCENKKLK